MRFNLSIFNWKDTFPLLKPLVPPISYSDYKGVMGRIGILGGSVDYTGAPYYAADAALKFGADLSFVFCSQEASAPIKSYSPELMVTPFYNDINMFSEDSSVVEQEILKSIAKVKDTLPRIHTLVVGPGLGRHPNVMKAVSQILEEARAANTHLVIDADGLWILANNPFLLRGYTKCIITPNKVEFERITEAVVGSIISSLKQDHNSEVLNKLLGELKSGNEVIRTRALSLALGGVTVFRKGESDLITSGTDVYAMHGSKGSPRRCGGQGDILAGSLGTAYYWATKMAPGDLPNMMSNLTAHPHSQEEFDSEVDLEDMAGCFEDIPSNFKLLMSKAFIGGTQRLAPASASVPSAAHRDRSMGVIAGLFAGPIVKKASELAFISNGRSMTSPIVLNHLGTAFQSMVDESPSEFLAGSVEK